MMRRVLSACYHRRLLSSSASKASPASISVKAYYIAKLIDIRRLEAQNSTYADKSFIFHSKAVTIELEENVQRYISVFQYGSVVFFNVPEIEHSGHLKSIRDAASDASVFDPLHYTEQYQMYINPTLEKTSVMKRSDQLFVRSLCSGNIQIVGAVMGQTVALDYYSESVDRMLELFMKMNSKIELSGQFKNDQGVNLHTLLARNNNIIANVILRLGILEGSDVAWNDSDASQTWDALREDFEIQERFKDFKTKVDLIKDNARFYLEMLHNKESNKLEIIIIILIAAEIAIGLTGLAI